jgi:hypothetical protein
MFDSTVGVINPIFKNIGDAIEPSSYRPITILSCFGKLFTSILDIRLHKFSEEKELINKFQCGFRKGYSTVDNMYVLKMIIDILQNSGKKMFCAFIDLKSAFDTICKTHLWAKLCSYDITGKCLNVVKIIYSNA